MFVKISIGMLSQSFMVIFRKEAILLFFVVFVNIPQCLFAQTNFWQDVNNEPVTTNTRLIIPQKYRVVKLDMANLKGMLQRSPMEFTTAAQNSSLMLELPTPDSKMQTFTIVESPIMEAELANKFPEIKTYSGYSINNQAITVRFDVTPAGFHAMVLSDGETYFIDPYSQGNTEFYISYYKKDFLTTKNFNCGVKTNEISTGDSTEIQNNKNTPKPIDIPPMSNVQFGDKKLRTYRLALAATGEYTTFHGGTVAGALAAQVTTMNRVNGVYIKDFSIRMNIIANNNLIIYTNSSTDPYTNTNGSTMLGQNQTNLTNVIGAANYDIGHVFSTGGGGVAYLQSVCNASNKAGGVTGSSSPVGDAFDIDYVAHEMGHQFGGNHTFNNSCSSNRNSSTAWEPGSGSTIMAYAGICSPNVQSNSDAHFHGGSLQEMYSFITGSGNSCAAVTTPVNAAPIISSYTPNQTIPKGTPFFLTGTATDADGNSSLTYCWEQMDNQISTQAPVGTSTGGPNFRSLSPTASGTRYFPKLSDLATNATTTWEVLPTVGRTLNFRLVVRDNSTVAGFNDRADVLITVDGTSGPLAVTSPTATGISWLPLSTQTVTWNVANTTAAPVSCANVDILLSTDGGLTYPTVLASSVPNSGTASITVPNVLTTTARIMVRGTGRIFFDISNNNFSIVCGAVAGSDSPKCTGSTLNLTSNGGISYLWAGPNSYTSTLQNPSISNITSAVAGTYTVKITNGTCTASATTVVATSTVPGQPSAFTVSSATVCQGANNVVYTIPAVAGATSYTWTYSGTGATITGTTNSVTLSFSGTATSGNLSVTANNICGSSIARTLGITVNSAPPQPLEFTTSTSILCQGDNSITYTMPAVSGATSYTWTYSGTGATITGTTNSVTVSFSGTATSGNLSVTANNICGSSVARTLGITVNSVPSQPSTFTTSSLTVCRGAINVVYSIPTVLGATSYVWTYSGTGATITGTGNSVTVSFSETATSGSLSVVATNTCGNSVARTLAINVNSIPTQPSDFTTSSPTVCRGATNVVYTIPTVVEATSYVWTYSGTGATITGTGNSVTVSFSGTATSGSLSVVATNTCGNSVARTLAINVNGIPTQPSDFTTSSPTVCRGATNVVYTIPTVVEATSYVWTYSGTGATITGTGNSVLVSFSETATSGSLSVVATNTCGNSIARTLAINVNGVPLQPSDFTASSLIVCKGTTNVVYMIPMVVEATSYVWTYSGTGATITGTSNSVTVDFSATATSGTLSVVANNACGSSSAQTLAISVLPIPTNPTTIQSGNWQTSSTWQCGVTPSITTDAIIGQGHIVTIDGIMVQVKRLIYEGGSVQMLNNGVLKLEN